jgi:hypothetical protein
MAIEQNDRNALHLLKYLPQRTYSGVDILTSTNPLIEGRLALCGMIAG